MYKFEKLEVWQLALDYIDLIYTIADQLPRHSLQDREEFNLKSQIRRAATSIALNPSPGSLPGQAGLRIAEGSTGQTDAQQARFLGLALRRDDRRWTTAASRLSSVIHRP